MTQKVTLKNDKYRKARGGHTRLLELSCSQCGEYLFRYQKDGVGILKRVYFDRIVGAGKWGSLEDLPLKKVPQLTCAKCQGLIGVPTIYKKEHRRSFHLLVGTIVKKTVKL